MFPIKIIVYKGSQALDKFYYGFNFEKTTLVTQLEAEIRSRIAEKEFSLSWIGESCCIHSIARHFDGFHNFLSCLQTQNGG